MRPAFTIVSALLVALAIPGSAADGCTSFLLKYSQNPVMAKNYDWDVAAGMLVVNPRGLAKSSLVSDELKPVRWTSRYGSVTFNQYGREFPTGGMNEAGLAMELLWLDDTVYPEPGERRSIGALQWIQYCLDSFRTVGDVVASASELAITSPTPLHFFACDATTNCAVIEFLDGELVSRSERTLPLPVLTNDSYADSLDYLNLTLGYGGDPVEPVGPGSLARFARAARGLHTARSRTDADHVAEAYAVLADVAVHDSTQWSIVYELSTGRIHVRTSTNSDIRTVDLTELELDCTSEPLMLDLAGEGSGDVTTNLVPYSSDANRKLIGTAFGAENVTAPAPEVIDLMAAYPDGLVCTYDASQ
jgi:choloylglycine hydrolase